MERRKWVGMTKVGDRTEGGLTEVCGETECGGKESVACRNKSERRNEGG